MLDLLTASLCASASLRRAQNLVEIDGVSLNVERVFPANARPGAPTLVFLHEELGSVQQWHELPALLSALSGCPAVIYDRPGFGESDALPAPRDAGYLQAEADARLPALLRALEIEDVVLIGHGEGGALALLYAAAEPDRVRRVVTLDAPVFLDDRLRRFVATADACAEALPLLQQLHRYHGDRAGDVFFDWTETWLSPEFAGWDITSRLPWVGCPVLAIQSAESAYVSPGQLQAICDGVMGPVQTLTLDGCDHSPHRRARERTLAAAMRFLQPADSARLV